MSGTTVLLTIVSVLVLAVLIYQLATRRRR
jgi:hypothetical protein